MALSKCPGCGSQLPPDSHFCPACGRALGEKERPRAQGDGSNGWITFLDKSWDLFASTKVATVLIALLAVASIGGSLIEQESLYQDWRPPYLYYPDRYGEFWGNLYMKLGLTHAYSSLWYAGLVLLCVISLIICSFHRLIPLHRTLTSPQVWKLPHFIRRQEVVLEVEGDLKTVEPKLRKMGYKLKQDRECVHGDKGRISRYGPYIIHIGLLMVAFSAFSKALPGWDLAHDFWIPDGGTVRVPGTEFSITSHKFMLETYPSGMPSRFATDASILNDEGTEVKRKDIEVNHPLTYQGWDIFQASWRTEPGIATIDVVLAADHQAVRSFEFDLKQPEPVYELAEDLEVRVLEYYHDFMGDAQTLERFNSSYEIRNPVVMVEFVQPSTELVLGIAALQVLNPEPTPIFDGPFYLKVDQVADRTYTALKMHKDRSIPFMYSGLAVVMAGMMITFFIFHYQVWAREEDGKVLIGARAYKNKFGLKQEFRRHFGLAEREVDE